MTTLNMAETAYAQNKAPIRTPRSTEYDAFARVTHRLKTAADGGTAGFAHLAAALHENRRLWTMLAADVAEQENALPRELRARIFFLAQFTTIHTSKILRGEDDVDALVDINTAIMRGLRGTSEAT